ncbi:MAG: MarR family transcriptional regulator [Planctomycetota bacterium]|nr:MAG: MarR family transcriptional regulator [Planctomycetota bacterium]
MTHTPSADNSVDARLAAALERLGQAVRTAWVEAGQAFGLSALQSQILVYLLQNAQGARLRPSAVAERLQVTRATLSDALAALETKGLLQRIPSTIDRRARELKLTPQGRRTAAKLSRWNAAMVQVLRSLPAGEKGRLLDLLLRLIAELQACGLITIARMCRSCAFFEPDVHDAPEAPHHCRLLDQPLKLVELRVDCPDYQPVE